MHIATDGPQRIAPVSGCVRWEAHCLDSREILSHPRPQRECGDYGLIYWDGLARDEYPGQQIAAWLRRPDNWAHDVLGMASATAPKRMGRERLDSLLTTAAMNGRRRRHGYVSDTHNAWGWTFSFVTGWPPLAERLGSPEMQLHEFTSLRGQEILLELATTKKERHLSSSYDECVERAVALAARETATAWDWADLAVEVAPMGESGRSNEAQRKLTKLRADASPLCTDLEAIPAVRTLDDYRAAAAAVPPKLRVGLSVRAGLEFRGASPSEVVAVLDSLDGERKTAQLIARRLAELREAQARPTFNQTNDNVGWARWTWNPVTGCLHNCTYCYARPIANRFYAEGFEPTFHPERLTAPQHTRAPRDADPAWRRVFTCSMADLFGKWVPQEWIDAVFEQIVAAPQWEFLCLTKFPQRLATLEWPDNMWAGTTVDKQHRVDLAQRHFAEVKAGVKWLSCEPLLEPLKFDSLEMFDWVVIGACTATFGGAEPRSRRRSTGWSTSTSRRVTRAAGSTSSTTCSAGGVGPGMEAVREWPR